MKQQFQEPQDALKQGRLYALAGQPQAAAKLFKQASQLHKRCSHSKEIVCLIQQAVGLLPLDWFSQYWARCIATAEAPNPLSSRDGRLLKPVPKQDQLTQPELIQKLQEAGKKVHDLQTKLLCQAWSIGKKADKAVLALMRGLAYAHAGRHTQALKDAKVVLAYGPQHEKGSCIWPWAHALHAMALEGLQDMVGAALAMQTAHELDPGCIHHQNDLQRLKRYIPNKLAEVLESEGAAGLSQWLADEEEQKKPEILKQRPKYYYYYEWMTERICGQYPALPEAVMDKLLTMPAGDLDLILQHPRSTTWKVSELIDVYEEGGSAAVDRYPLQGLTWEQVKELKGPNLVGLGFGSGPAPGESLIEQEPNRHEQLMAGAEVQCLLGGTPADCGTLPALMQDSGKTQPAFGLSGDLEALEM